MLYSALAQVFPRPSTRHTTPPPSLPEDFNVGLAHDWSGMASSGASEPRWSVSATAPPSQIPVSPAVGESNDESSVNNHDLLNDALSDLSASLIPPTRVYRSIYGKKLPILEYDATSYRSSDISSASSMLSYDSQETDFKAPSLYIPPSPTPSTVTRPYFIPSRASTPLEASNSQTSSRKRKASSVVSPSPELYRFISGKRSRTQEILEISDDENDNSEGSYNIKLYNTGYQTDSDSNSYYNASAQSEFLTDRDKYSRLKAESSDYGTAYSHESTPSVSVKIERGTHTMNGGNLCAWPEGGRIRFCAKPDGFDDQALLRWSFSINGPDSSTVHERAEGDIHFSPTRGRGTNEMYAYWVCVFTTHGFRWVSFVGGQPHPLYANFVLKQAVLKTMTPPRWVKESSFRSSSKANRR